MEFESTLQKESDRIVNAVKQRRAEGEKESELGIKIFDLIKDSHSVASLKRKSIDIAKTIQPSILEVDIKIACTLQMALAFHFVHNLVQEGLISIKNE